MSIRNRNWPDWPIWEVLGRSLDFLFYVAMVAFFVALAFEPARSSFLLVLAPAVLALVFGAVDVLRN